jgi:hypothetical protein
MDSLSHASEASPAHFGWWRADLGNRLSVTGDHDTFAGFDGANQFREAIFGFGGAHSQKGRL